MPVDTFIDLAKSKIIIARLFTVYLSSNGSYVLLAFSERNAKIHCRSTRSNSIYCCWKILFLVAVGEISGGQSSEGGILGQASETSLTTKVPRVGGFEVHTRERSVHTGKAEKTHHLVPIRYLFSTSVSDPSRGFFQSRSEARSQDGLVKGQYSYMDGFYKVKVVYSAGPNGFRIIRQERIPLKKLEQVTTTSPHQHEKDKKFN